VYRIAFGSLDDPECPNVEDRLAAVVWLAIPKVQGSSTRSD
jgi:hypothetical protein